MRRVTLNDAGAGDLGGRPAPPATPSGGAVGRSGSRCQVCSNPVPARTLRSKGWACLCCRSRYDADGRLLSAGSAGVIVGARLLARRKELRISAERLTAEVGMNRSYLQRLERDGGNPTLDTILTLCKAMRLSPSALVDRLDELTSESLASDLVDKSTNTAK